MKDVLFSALTPGANSLSRTDHYHRTDQDYLAFDT